MYKLFYYYKNIYKKIKRLVKGQKQDFISIKNV